MGDESRVRQKAREAIRAGKLPDRPPQRMWGGRGCGAGCTVCGEPVKESDFELEFALGDDGVGSDHYHTHIQCFQAWEVERASNADIPMGDGLPGASSDGTIAARESLAPLKREST